MNKQALKQADISDLVAQYAVAASRFGEALEKVSARAAKREATTVLGIYQELTQRGSYAQLALLKLFVHDDPHVRRWAAFHAIDFAPEEAEAQLNELSHCENRVVRAAADMALKTWRRPATGVSGTSFDSPA